MLALSASGFFCSNSHPVRTDDTNPDFVLSTQHVCARKKNLPTLNLHKPPMSSLLSKQTGSRPSSRQDLMEARPALPPPITATRRGIFQLCKQQVRILGGEQKQGKFKYQ